LPTDKLSPGFPEHLNELPVLFEAFGDDSRLMSPMALTPGRADEQTAAIFGDKQVRFINLRNAEAGCFIATVEREQFNCKFL
jgi:hypothetical protein